MKNAMKTLFTASVVIGLLAFFGYIFGGNSNQHVEVSKTKAQQNDLSSGQAVTATISQPTNQTTAKTLENTDKSTTKKIQWDKKQLNEQWCYATTQLNDSDYRLAQAQQQEWEIQQGKAKTRGRDHSQFHEEWTPNNQYIEAYESLPIEELRSLAYEGDKWAMVAFVQHSRAPKSMQNEIAKRLMVLGASYYGLERLVINMLVLAEMSIEKKDLTSAKKFIIEAVAYSYWGLEYYNDGGLQPFIAITKREPFLTQYPISAVLKISEKEINQRLAELKAQIAQQRAALYIEVPEPSATIEKMFASNIAIRDRMHKEQMDILRSLNITNSERLQSTPCTVKINVHFEEFIKAHDTTLSQK